MRQFEPDTYLNKKNKKMKDKFGQELECSDRVLHVVNVGRSAVEVRPGFVTVAGDKYVILYEVETMWDGKTRLVRSGVCKTPERIVKLEGIAHDDLIMNRWKEMLETDIPYEG